MNDDQALSKARALLARAPVFDGHNDLPWVKCHLPLRERATQDVQQTRSGEGSRPEPLTRPSRSTAEQPSPARGEGTTSRPAPRADPLMVMDL
jgi:hypothetical protein